MCVWFGNFYRPAFDDRAFIDSAMESIAGIGFNCVELDSKAWADFEARFNGELLSQYVAQQEYMMDSAAGQGLAFMFLALYLNGDNLYPNIRYSPPLLGESITKPDGTDGNWYKYWSEQAQMAQVQHVSGLLKTYSGGSAQLWIEGQQRIPVCSMWDPVVAPSFDREGIERYHAWLEKRYKTIEAFNRAYWTGATSFEDLQPQEYWFEAAYGEGRCYTEEDRKSMSPAFVMWADNMIWRAEELSAYFGSMQRQLHGLNGQFWLMPNLAQWSHYLNMDTSVKTDIGLSELWDTAMRGIDMRAAAPYVDMCHFYTVPVTPDGDADAYVVACQHAYIRSLNQGRMFLGGIYYGRFLYSDIYRLLTPEEIIGSIVGSGVGGIAAYGYCGMDDGGLLHRMNDAFTESLTRGNAWAKAVIPLLGARKRSHVAILFPAASALLEPLKVEGAARRRMDLLGLYRACCDYGYAPDIVEKEDIICGLEGVDVLLIAADSCYRACRSAALEEALRAFVVQGGTVMHGICSGPVHYVFDIRPSGNGGLCYTYQGEGGLLSGGAGVSFPGEALAVWRENGGNCISRTGYGRGQIISFGFMPGYQISSRTAPHVPPGERNNALYPMTHMRHNPLRDLLEQYAGKDVPAAQADVECAAFEHGLIVVNHRSTPVCMPDGGRIIAQQTVRDGLLPAHSAAYLELEAEI